MSENGRSDLLSFIFFTIQIANVIALMNSFIESVKIKDQNLELLEFLLYIVLFIMNKVWEALVVLKVVLKHPLHPY